MSTSQLKRLKSNNLSPPVHPAYSEARSSLSGSSGSWANAIPEYSEEFALDDYGMDQSISANWGADGLAVFQHYIGEEIEYWEEEEDVTLDRKLHQPSGDKTPITEVRKKTLIVHSSPSLFPDIHKARKSVFGSTFLRAPLSAAEESSILKTVVDSNYNMLHSLLSSFDKILTGSSEVEQKQITVAYKESLLRALESHGITKSYSDGSIHWDIYPVTQSSLFSIQVGNHVHQTRNLSRIENRIVTGPVQSMKLPHEWPTDSMWTGHWDELGMAGTGAYIMPHGVMYNGKMRDGVFHDNDATLTYPNKFNAIHCVYDNGKLINCQFQFPDALNHEKQNWEYCKFPDRRFWSEVRNGLKPAKIAQKTEVDPPRRIPSECYDTNDGFYHPKALTLISPSGELLRVPVCEEDIWIKKYCRKGFLQPTNFRPDLFENWFEQDLIDEILEQQNHYRNGRITYDELQQYYADQNLLPSWSKYQRNKSQAEIAYEEYLKSITEPSILRSPKLVKKYVGHKLPSEIFNTFADGYRTPSGLQDRKIKSLNKIRRSSKGGAVTSQQTMNVRSSRISFKIDSDGSVAESENLDKSSSLLEQRNIPIKKISERYLEPQPLLRPPFFRGHGGKKNTVDKSEAKKSKGRKKCSDRRSRSASRARASVRDNSEAAGKRSLQEFMKTLVMEAMEVGLLEERDRHRERLLHGRKVPPKAKSREGPNDKCLGLLRELFDSIPDKDEGCDSDVAKSLDLRKLAEDKYRMLKYWGRRMFALDFEEEKEVHYRPS